MKHADRYQMRMDNGPSRCECGASPTAKEHRAGKYSFFWYECPCGNRTYATMDRARALELWNDRKLEESE